MTVREAYSFGHVMAKTGRFGFRPVRVIWSWRLVWVRVMLRFVGSTLLSCYVVAY